MSIPTPKARQLICIQQHGGKRALWHAYLSPISKSAQELLATLQLKHNGSVVNWKGGIGAGNTAENAIKDYQKMFRILVKRGDISLKDLTPLPPKVNANPNAPVSFIQKPKMKDAAAN